MWKQGWFLQLRLRGMPTISSIVCRRAAACQSQILNARRKPVNHLRSTLGADMNKKFWTRVKWNPKPHGRAGPRIRSFGVATMKMTHSVACGPQGKVHWGSLGARMGRCATHTACWLTLYCDKEEENLWQLVYLSQQKPASPLTSGGLPYLPSGIAFDPVAAHYHLSKDNVSKTLRDT